MSLVSRTVSADAAAGARRTAAFHSRGKGLRAKVARP